MPAKKKAKSSGLRRFFSNPRNIILVAFIIGFAGFGSYKVYQSSADSYVKGPSTISGCKNSGVYLRSGSRGTCVIVLQQTLNGVRIITGNKWEILAEDGKFGAKTDAVVRAYQRLNGAAVDGIVGPQTWAALSYYCSNSAIKNSTYCR